MDLCRHSRRPLSAARGFTLTELLIGVVVSSIGLMAVAAGFVGVQGAVAADSDAKGAIESTRLADAYLERVVRLAGYGVDPRFAFDFNGDKAGIVGANPAFWSDDLALRYRDPAFLRRGSLGSGGLTLALEGSGALAEMGLKLKQGQALLLACSGAQAWWVGTLLADSDEKATSIVLQAYGAPFDSTPPSCLRGASGTSSAYVFLLHELRIRVASLGGQPYLVAYHGLGDPGANTSFDPIAANVEYFKVEYVMNRPQANSTCCLSLPPVDGAAGNWILGDSSADARAYPDPAALAPSYDTAYDDPSRFNAHPANVRFVRLTVGARGGRTLKPNSMSGRAAAAAVIEGIPVPELPANYQRTSLRTTLRVPNLASRSFFVPALKAPSSADLLNVWGG